MVMADDFVHVFEPGNAPTLLLLHGTGGNENDLVGIGQAIAPGATIMSPRGKVLENGMPRYFRRLAEGVFDMDDLHARTAELATWIGSFTAANDIVDQAIVAIGFSNGANMAGSLLLSNPGLLAGAILLRPMTPFVPAPLPGLSGTRVLIGAGTQDPLIPAADSERLGQLLTACGAEVATYWQPGGHGLAAGDLDRCRAWFDAQTW